MRADNTRLARLCNADTTPKALPKPFVLDPPLPKVLPDTARGPSGSLIPPDWLRRDQQRRGESGEPIGELISVRFLRWLSDNTRSEERTGQRQLAWWWQCTTSKMNAITKNFTNKPARCKLSRAIGC